jgi:hypothetical protein
VIAQAKIKQRTEEWEFMDVLNGVQCSLLANINRSRDSTPYKPEDFRIMKADKRQTPEEIAQVMDRMAGVHHE